MFFPSCWIKISKSYKERKPPSSWVMTPVHRPLKSKSDLVICASTEMKDKQKRIEKSNRIP